MTKNLRRIILIINVIIIIAILGYLIYSFFIKYKSADEQQIVDFKGYRFKIDSDLTFESKDDSILIGTINSGWNATIAIMGDPNNVVFSDTNRINEILRFKGYDISDGVVHTLDDRQYITFERKMSEESLIPYVLLGFYKNDDNHICEIIINDNVDVNGFNYQAFERIVKILRDAEYDSEKDATYQYMALTFKGTLQALYGEEQSEENPEQ